MPIPNYISFRSYDKPPLSPYRTSFEKKKAAEPYATITRWVLLFPSVGSALGGGGAASRVLGFKY